MSVAVENEEDHLHSNEPQEEEEQEQEEEVPLSPQERVSQQLEQLDSAQISPECFDVVGFVNSLFPDRRALAGRDGTQNTNSGTAKTQNSNIGGQGERDASALDAARVTISAKIDAQERMMRELLRARISGSAKGREDLKNAQNAISDLVVQMSEIKRKAEESEQLVTSLCADIKSLDYAKRNLTATIATVKRVNMFRAAIDQLDDVSKRGLWRESAMSLASAMRLQHFFSDFADIPKIAELNRRVNVTVEELQSQVYVAFTKYMESPDAVSKSMNDACAIIEAMGERRREAFVRWFVERLMNEYKRVFDSKKAENATLANSNKRYEWAKDTLEVYDEQFKHIFPESWHVDEMFVEDFCLTTRGHFFEVLENLVETAREQRESAGIAVPNEIREAQQLATAAVSADTLVEVLKSTQAFERKMSEKFANSAASLAIAQNAVPVQSGTRQNKPSDEDDMLTEDERIEAQLNPHSAAAIRARWKAHQRQKAMQAAAVDAGDATPTPMVRVERFRRMISSCFDSYLWLWAKKEEHSMNDAFDKLIKEESWMVESDEGVRVLTSSTDLVFYFKNQLRVGATISRGKPLVDVARAFVDVLRKYRQRLIQKLPADENALGRDDASTIAIKLSEMDAIRICLIINTCEYMAQTCDGMHETLERLLDKRIRLTDDPADAKRDSNVVLVPDFDAARQEFETGVTLGLKTCVLGLQTKIAPSLTTMTKQPWASWESVGDQSDYVNSIALAIENLVPVYRRWLTSKVNFTWFCDAFCMSWIPLLIDAIFKCKRISDAAAPQLMLDFTAIKGILLDLPNAGIATTESTVDSDSDDATDTSIQKQEDRIVVSGRYTRHVSKNMGRADLIMKTIMTPAESLVDTYKGLVPDGTAEELGKILELKGLTKQSQKSLLAQYFDGSPPMSALSSVPSVSDELNSVAESSRKLGQRFLEAFSSKSLDQ